MKAVLESAASATTTHPAFKFFGGDDWQIEATLTDETGAPLDLTDAQILWTMNDSKGMRVLEDSDFTITVVDAPGGICSIKVPSTRTTEIAGATYSDAFRIVTGDGVTSTLSVGTIYVTADPFVAAVEAKAAVPVNEPRLRLAKG